MTTTDVSPVQQLRCGCCGRARPADQLAELCSTPGVHMCAGCGLWAARHASRLPFPHVNLRAVVNRLRGRGRDHHGEAFRMAIPVLPVSDLARAVSYYEQLGFHVAEHLDQFAILQSDSIELHLSAFDQDRTPVHVFVHIGDPDRLWKRFADHGVANLGQVQTQPWGIRDFQVTDPDGNFIRFGHPES